MLEYHSRYRLKLCAHSQGVKRRLENKGTYKGITIYDDFAHHPTEIECALEAVCDHVPR
jgi:UDP-N-acetylmuramate-alanine ligase